MRKRLWLCIFSLTLLQSCTQAPIPEGKVTAALTQARALKEQGKFAESLSLYDRVLQTYLTSQQAAEDPQSLLVPNELAQMAKDYRPARSALITWRDSYEKLVTAKQASPKQEEELKLLNQAIDEVAAFYKKREAADKAPAKK